MSDQVNEAGSAKKPKISMAQRVFNRSAERILSGLRELNPDRLHDLAERLDSELPKTTRDLVDALTRKRAPYPPSTPASTAPSRYSGNSSPRITDAPEPVTRSERERVG